MKIDQFWKSDIFAKAEALRQIISEVSAALPLFGIRPYAMPTPDQVRSSGSASESGSGQVISFYFDGTPPGMAGPVVDTGYSQSEPIGTTQNDPILCEYDTSHPLHLLFRLPHPNSDPQQMRKNFYYEKWIRIESRLPPMPTRRELVDDWWETLTVDTAVGRVPLEGGYCYISPTPKPLKGFDLSAPEILERLQKAFWGKLYHVHDAVVTPDTESGLISAAQEGMTSFVHYVIAHKYEIFGQTGPGILASWSCSYLGR